MVRRAEGARFNERGVVRQNSRNGVNFGRFDHFLKAHLRQNGRQPFRKQLLPEPGEPMSNTLCPPLAAISKARFACACPFTSAKSGSGG